MIFDIMCMVINLNILNKTTLDKDLKAVLINRETSIDFEYTSYNQNDTMVLGEILAKYLNKSDILVLNGELGSGKTVLMSGIAKFYNIEDKISSPTFTIVNEYSTNSELKIFHFDMYRLNSLEEFIDDIGTEYFSNGLCVIEWGELVKDILPKHTIYIDFKKDITDDNKRYLHIWRK